MRVCACVGGCGNSLLSVSASIWALSLAVSASDRAALIEESSSSSAGGDRGKSSASNLAGISVNGFGCVTVSEYHDIARI